MICQLYLLSLEFLFSFLSSYVLLLFSKRLNCSIIIVKRKRRRDTFQGPSFCKSNRKCLTYSYFHFLSLRLILPLLKVTTELHLTELLFSFDAETISFLEVFIAELSFQWSTSLAIWFGKELLFSVSICEVWWRWDRNEEKEKLLFRTNFRRRMMYE